jgi:hypothetical protein
MVIDTGEAEILERGLAQILKEALVRRLRRNVTCPDVLQQLTELVTRQRLEVSKCLWFVDFRFCRAIESRIVRCDGFIFL